MSIEGIINLNPYTGTIRYVRNRGKFCKNCEKRWYCLTDNEITQELYIFCYKRRNIHHILGKDGIYTEIW